MGTSVVAETNDRSIGDFRGSLASVVIAGVAGNAVQLNHAPCESARVSHRQAVTIGLAFEFEIPRAHCPDYLP